MYGLKGSLDTSAPIMTPCSGFTDGGPTCGSSGSGGQNDSARADFPPLIERLIGTIRREYLDHTRFWNADDLERKLDTFKDYYNGYRVHASLAGKTPEQVNRNQHLPSASLDRFAWRPHCRGLFQTPVAA